MKDDYERWRNLIGDFMLEFAKVEGELNRLLSDLATDTEFEEVLKKNFKERRCEAEKLLYAQVQDSTLAARAVKSLVSF